MLASDLARCPLFSVSVLLFGPLFKPETGAVITRIVASAASHAAVLFSHGARLKFAHATDEPINRLVVNPHSILAVIRFMKNVLARYSSKVYR
jgi:hypothetical protein